MPFSCRAVFVFVGRAHLKRRNQWQDSISPALRWQTFHFHRWFWAIKTTQFDRITCRRNRIARTLHRHGRRAKLGCCCTAKQYVWESHRRETNWDECELLPSVHRSQLLCVFLSSPPMPPPSPPPPPPLPLLRQPSVPAHTWVTHWFTTLPTDQHCSLHYITLQQRWSNTIYIPWLSFWL